MDEVFRVVFICTGNRCRSPYAAKLFESLTKDLPVDVDSVGTLDAPMKPSPQELVTIAEAGGIDLSRHGAQPLHAGALGDADLVIGFSFDHVSSAVVHGGAQRRRTFLLPEITRLLKRVDVPAEDAPIARARHLVAAAHDLRGPGSSPSIEEIADPFGGPESAYRMMVDDVDRHIRVLVERLFDPARLDRPRAP